MTRALSLRPSPSLKDGTSVPSKQAKATERPLCLVTHDPCVHVVETHAVSAHSISGFWCHPWLMDQTMPRTQAWGPGAHLALAAVCRVRVHSTLRCSHGECTLTRGCLSRSHAFTRGPRTPVRFIRCQTVVYFRLGRDVRGAVQCCPRAHTLSTHVVDQTSWTQCVKHSRGKGGAKMGGLISAVTRDALGRLGSGRPFWVLCLHARPSSLRAVFRGGAFNWTLGGVHSA